MLVPVEGAGIVDSDTDAFGIHDGQNQLRMGVAIDGGQLDGAHAIPIVQPVAERHAEHRPQPVDRLLLHGVGIGAVVVHQVEIDQGVVDVHPRQLFHARLGVQRRVVVARLIGMRHAARRGFRRVEFVGRHPALGLGLDEGGVACAIALGVLEILQQHVGADVAGFHRLIVIEIGVDVAALEQGADIRPAILDIVHQGADGLGIVGVLAHRPVLVVIETPQRAEAFGALGRQDVDDPVAHLVALVGIHH